MAESVTPGWRFVHIGFSGDAVDIGGGVNPWSHDWKGVKTPPIIVAHPAYPEQRHRMEVYEIRTGWRRVRFAAGEFSNSVYGFFVPTR